METKTIYVPSTDKMLKNRVYFYDKKDYQWYVETPVEKQEDMVVMTKAEFSDIADIIWTNAANYFMDRQNQHENLEDTIKSILK